MVSQSHNNSDQKFYLSDSSFLDDLERRLNVAEEKYREADLEAKLKQLEEAKQRQVNVKRTK